MISARLHRGTDNRRKVCVVTGSRADYGILSALMRGIKFDNELTLQVAVTGSHLEKRFGFTYKEIIKDGFKIDAKIYNDLAEDSAEAIASATGLGVAGFGKELKRLSPDIVVVLGDRFEILAATVAATLLRLPIAHIHGGEITRGAYDDAMRHSITKMAYLHFVCHKDYADRVIRMGEHPGRVFNYGALALDNIKEIKLLTERELSIALNFKVDRDTALVTFHPETLKVGAAAVEVKNLLKALDKSGLRCVFTTPNADTENEVIYRAIKEYSENNPAKARLFTSLGRVKYFSAMKYCGLMAGNSSSGIIEAASFKLPVVNIGNRQEGRIKPANVIDCTCDFKDIYAAVSKALSGNFRDKLKNLKNPFGDGNTALRIKNKLKTADISDLAKGFYDYKN